MTPNNTKLVERLTVKRMGQMIVPTFIMLACIIATRSLDLSANTALIVGWIGGACASLLYAALERARA